MTKTKKKDWEERFDDLGYFDGNLEFPIWWLAGAEAVRVIKHFISILLSEQKQELKEEIRKMRKGWIEDNKEYKVHGNIVFGEGVIEGLRLVLKLL